MTTRHSGYIITLEKDLRNDDDEEIRTAIRMIRGVLSCEPIKADDIGVHIATERVRMEVSIKLSELQRQVLWGEKAK
jgi:hypothetical protein